ncbi:MAG TPA: oligosaccharide flippase family protein [Bacilli bacterium]|nr:oligosaccharide flippase family protein [Bacilli bacterium]
MSPLLRMIWAFGYKLFLAVITFSISLITGRYLGASGRGFYTNTTTYLVYYQPGVGVFSDFIPFAINKKKYDPQKVLSTSLSFWLMLSVSIFALMLLTTKWMWSGFLGLEPETTRGIWIAGLLVPFALLQVYLTRFVWGLNQLEWLNRLNTMQGAFLLGLLLVVLVGMRPPESVDVYWALGAWVVSFVLASLVSIYVVTRKLGYKLLPKADPQIRRENFSFGSRMLVGNLIFALNARIDVTLVWAFMTQSATGVYGIAISSAEMLNLISNSIIQVVLTRMASLDEKDSTLLTVRIFRHTAVVIVFSVIGMALFMPLMIALYGPEYSSALQPFYILLPGIALFSLAMVLIQYFNNQLGRPQVMSWMQLISIATTVILSSILMPRFGEIGAAMAKTGGFTLFFLAVTGYFAYVTKFPFFKLFLLTGEEIGQYKSFLGKIFNRLRR